MSAALEIKVVEIEGRLAQVEDGHTRLTARVGTLEEKALKDIGRILEGQKSVETRVAEYTTITFSKIQAMSVDRQKDAKLVKDAMERVDEVLLSATRYRDKLPSLSEFEPQVNPDGSASLPPGAFHSIQENIARQRAELVEQTHELALEKAARDATDKALAQFHADRKKEREEQRAEEEERRKDQAKIDDARISRIKKWAAVGAGLAATAATGLTWAYHVWLTIHH